MALLPFSQCQPGEIETGCDFLFEFGEQLVLAGEAGLAPYLPDPGNPCDDTFDTYVSLGPPIGEFHDALSAQLDSYGPTQESLARLGRQSVDSPGVFPIFEARWTMTLLETGYPGVWKQGEEVHVPSTSTLHNLNRYIYAHGIGAYDAVSQAINRRELTTDRRWEKIVIGPMLPVTPQGGSAGWKWTVVAVSDR